MSRDSQGSNSNRSDNRSSAGTHSTPQQAAMPSGWDWPTAFLLALVHAGALLAPYYYSLSALAVGALLYVITAMGITLGYHRLLTHRSYKTYPILEYLFTTAGALAGQGGPISWTAIHRLHHKSTDKEGDPHGAHHGFWWSHIGWMLFSSPQSLDPKLKTKYAADLEAKAFHRFLETYWLLLIVGLGFCLLRIGGMSWLVWGLFVRMTLVYHATWLVNSAGHKFGYRTYDTGDLSTNCWWVALLTFGEGWHNNHHAFPYSARHGLHPTELDLTWLAIKLLHKLGLAWDIKLARTT